MNIISKNKLNFFGVTNFTENSMNLTVGLWGNVKNGFTWKIIIVLKVRGGHGE